MSYPNPFIIERADPYVTKGADGYYYFTASYPAYLSVDRGYDRIVLRRSKTVAGLRDAKEHTVWTAHTTGNMGAHIWAPEIHYINGAWYILFAAGDREDVWHIRPYFLKCTGDDPINDSYIELGRAQGMDDDNVSFEDFSLDMTYFEHNGEHYLLWAEKRGDSVIMMARINPDEPNKLISKPIMLTKPEYDWELIRYRVNEGPSVLKHGDKIIVFFSASGTGEEYCMGMLWADKDSNLMDICSWHKESSPILSTKDLVDEVGPGHNSFVVDENSMQLIVYHARPASHLNGECGTYCDETLYDPCRHARIREVTFGDDDLPIIK